MDAIEVIKWGLAGCVLLLFLGMSAVVVALWSAYLHGNAEPDPDDEPKDTTMFEGR